MVPKFDSFFTPYLKCLSDGNIHNNKDLVEYAVKYFNLTEEEAQERIANQSQTQVYNRVLWAGTYLRKAGLAEKAINGQYKITIEGQKRLKAGEVTLRTLAEYPAFVEFYGRKPKANTKQKKEVIAIEEVEKTPIEVLEEAYSQLNNQLADDVLASLKDVSPQKFEQIVVDVLVGMGYGGSLEDAGTVTAYVKDDGIDGVIKEDKLGLDKIYVQAKRWNNCVGQPEIQKFVGALVGQGAKKGVFITTSYFSKEARQFQPKGDIKVVLIDGKELANYMIECGVGVSLKQSYQIKRIDTDYFEE